MAIFRGTKEEIEKYRKSEFVNQSTLKELDKGLEHYKRWLKKQEEEETPKYFVIGSAMDCLLTSPSDFNDMFYVSNLEKLPSEAIMKILKDVAEGNLDVALDLRLQGAIKKHNYYPSRNSGSVAGSILNDIVAMQYYDTLIKSRGRQILSKDDWELSMAMSTNLKESERTSWLFDDRYERCCRDIYYQKPFYSGNKKVLPDILIVERNDELKTVQLQIVDIKTTSDDIANFPFSIEKYKYYLQLAYYQMVIYETKFWGDYNLIFQNPLIAVQSTDCHQRPCIFEIYMKKSYFDKMSELLDLYSYYKNTNFMEDKKVLEYGGWVQILKDYENKD